VGFVALFMLIMSCRIACLDDRRLFHKYYSIQFMR